MRRHLQFWALYVATLIIATQSYGQIPKPGHVFHFDEPNMEDSIPQWLAEPIWEPGATTSRIRIPVKAEDPEQNLLISFVFLDQSTGFCRVLWQGDTGVSISLCTNLYEGIALLNQRSLVVSASDLNGDGDLIIEFDEEGIPIQKLKLAWLDPVTVFTDDAKNAPVAFPSDGPIVEFDEAMGLAAREPEDTWTKDILAATLTPAATDIKDGVAFAFTLDRTPGLSILSGEINGLPLNSFLHVWINEAYAGVASVGVPDLHDFGYSAHSEFRWHYAGWRTFSLWVDTTLLELGENTIQLDPVSVTPEETEDPFSLSEDAIAVRKLVLQLKKPASPEPMQEMDPLLTSEPVESE
ncbi:MAG: hypothetical protein AAF558_08160 [Verrucomicrobiota bacterium]